MSENLVKLYTTAYSMNLELALQQVGSKLRDKVTTGSYTGKMASPIQQIEPVQMRTPSRFAPKTNTNADFTRRWVFPVDKEMDQYFDTFDALKTLIDPKSPAVAAAAAAAGREFDDEIIRQATGTNYTGVDAGNLSSETFNTTLYRIADSFGAAAATGLTVAKIIEAKRIFRHNHVDLDMDPVTLVIGSQQESDLLNQVQVVSTDFNDKPVLVDGRVQKFLGFNIVVMERLPTYTTNTRGVLAFAKSGIHLGVWKDIGTEISRRNDLSGQPWDLWTSMSTGATRTRPGKILQLACYDTTGADVVP